MTQASLTSQTLGTIKTSKKMRFCIDHLIISIAFIKITYFTIVDITNYYNPQVEFGQDEGGLVNSTNESFDNEDDEDEDEDDDDEEEEEVGDVPASSSSGIEEGAQS